MSFHYQPGADAPGHPDPNGWEPDPYDDRPFHLNVRSDKESSMATGLFVDPGVESTLVVDHDANSAGFLTGPVVEIAPAVLRRARGRAIVVDVTGPGRGLYDALRQQAGRDQVVRAVRWVAA